MNRPERPDDRAARVRQWLLAICLVTLVLALVLDFALARQQALARSLVWLAALVFASALLIVFRRSARRGAEAPPGDGRQALSAAEATALVAELAHALRTPLMAIQGFSELLSTRVTSETTRQEWLQVLGSEAQRMSAVLERAQEFVRLRSGRVKLRPESIDLASWLRDTFGNTGGTRVDLAAENEGVPTLTTHIDTERLRLAVRLLIERLEAAAPPTASRTIVVSRSCLAPEAKHFGAASCPGGASVSISAEDAEFAEPVAQQLEALDRGEISPGGIDLGVAREILLLHGGALWADENGPEGTPRVGFCLPAS
jgi:signal transduction histidine kinase